MAIGAPGNDGNGNFAGHVRVYAESGGTWTQVGSDIDGEAADDGSGSSVSLSSDGTRVAIGAWGNKGNGHVAGHVRVYEESVGTWTQVGADIDGAARGDWFGFSVSLSAVGTRVAIGAPFNGDNGNFAGHVRVYVENGGTWTQVGPDIDGEAADDQSGIVSLSSDGTRMAIGASSNDAGHVRVYDLHPCDASTAPQNGGVGDCTSSLASGSYESCTNVCPADSNYYEGKCSFFSQKNEERWCKYPSRTDEVCCASTSDDCCPVDEGLIAGVAVGVILTISLCCVACCYCCKCCCFKYRQNQNPPVVMYVPQPGVQMQQMSYPPQQGYNPGEIVVAAPAQPTTQIQFADGTTLTPEQGQAKV